MYAHKQTVSFRSDRAMRNKEIRLGFEGDNLVERIEFILPEIGEFRTATLMITGADAVQLEETESGRYAVDLTAEMIGPDGEREAYIRMDGSGGEVWQSAPMRLITGALPDVEEEIEKVYPTAVGQMLTAMAEHRAEMEDQEERVEGAAKRAVEAAKRAEEAGGSGGGAMIDATPESFGAKGDGVTDDSDAMQAALDYCNENQTGLYLTSSAGYRITKSLVLRDSGSYSLYSNIGNHINILADIEDGGALFIGDQSGWTTLRMYMVGVNVRVYNSGASKNNGAIFTCFRGLIFSNCSVIGDCKFYNFGTILEGTLRVCSVIRGCVFYGIKDAFMDHRYMTDGVYNEDDGIDLFADSKIVRSYISGCADYMPVCFRMNNIDYDSQINECFIENFRTVFATTGTDSSMRGCHINHCTIQQCCKLFSVPMVSLFDFANCDFRNFNEKRIREVAAACDDVETLCAAPIGVFVKTGTEYVTAVQISFVDCTVSACNYFIYYVATTNTYTRAAADAMIIERGTKYYDNALIADAVYVKVGNYFESGDAYGLAFKHSYFETLDGMYVDTLPEIVADGADGTPQRQYVVNTFSGQTIYCDGNIYVAVFNSTTNTPEFKQINN